jgi:chloramphenicol-sensitive protein RarD
MSNLIGNRPFIGQPAHTTSARAGLVCGFGAYLMWGFVPLYFKLVAHVPAMQVLWHRVVWSFIFVMGLVAATGRLPDLRATLRDRRTLLMLAASTILLSINWFTFIHAVAHDVVIQASLGYFINPLVSVVLGMVFLDERLRRWQFVGVVLAVAGVALLTWSRGYVPWIALVLAGSFGLYGLLRKVAPVGAMIGLTIETALLVLPAIACIAFERPWSQAIYERNTYWLLMLAGVITAVPLLLFAAAARRLRLATMGFLQYVGPTCQFLLAVLVFHEPFNATDLISFCLIWSALAMYSWDSYLAFRLQQQQATPAVAAGMAPLEV